MRNKITVGALATSKTIRSLEPNRAARVQENKANRKVTLDEKASIYSMTPRS